MITITSPLWPTMASSFPTFGSVIATLIVGYVIFEVAFFFHYKRHYIPFANEVSYRPPAPHRDYPKLEDREKLLCRIINQLIERFVHEGGNADDTAAVTEFAYNFIESWFVKRTDDAQYRRFSAEFDMATLDAGLCPLPPAMLRTALSSSVGMNAETSSDDDDDNVSKKSSSESLLVLEGEHPPDNNPNAKIGRLQKGNMEGEFCPASI